MRMPPRRTASMLLMKKVEVLARLARPHRKEPATWMSLSFATLVKRTVLAALTHKLRDMDDV